MTRPIHQHHTDYVAGITHQLDAGTAITYHNAPRARATVTTESGDQRAELRDIFGMVGSHGVTIGTVERKMTTKVGFVYVFRGG